MPDREQPGVGATLKRARESRGLTLRELADRTKIPVRTFEAIERDDVKRLPAGIFGRAFVRTYAAEAGLDPEATVESFFAQFAEPEPELPDEDRAPAREIRLPIPAELTRIAAVVVPILALASWAYLGRSGEEPPPPIAAAPIPAVRVDLPAPGPIPAASDVVRAGGAVADGSLSLRIVARRDCWVSAASDGEGTYRQLMKGGDEVTLDARRELVVQLGDAGAVSLALNGVPMQDAGGPGEVVTLRIDHENAHEYAVARPLLP